MKNEITIADIFDKTEALTEHLLEFLRENTKLKGENFDYVLYRLEQDGCCEICYTETWKVIIVSDETETIIQLQWYYDEKTNYQGTIVETSLKK